MPSTEIDPLSDTTQPMLPGLDVGRELLRVEVGSVGPQHTGKIVDKDAARVHGILTARAMGLSVRQVCAAYRCGPHTLATLEAKHGSKLATLKSRVASRLAVFAELGIDRMLEKYEEMDIDKLPIAVAVAIDKLQVLTGEPSVIVGHEHGGPREFSVDSLRDRLAGAIDVTPAPGMGLAGTNNDQTRAALEERSAAGGDLADVGDSD